MALQPTRSSQRLRLRSPEDPPSLRVSKAPRRVVGQRGRPPARPPGIGRPSDRLVAPNVGAIEEKDIAAEVSAQVIGDARLVKHWSDQVSLHESVIKFNLGKALDKEAILKAGQMAKQGTFAAEGHVDVQHFVLSLIPNLGPVGAFMVRIDGYGLSVKTALGTLKIIALFKNPHDGLTKFALEYAQRMPTWISPRTEFEWLEALDSKADLRKEIRTYQQQAIAKVGKLPEDTRVMIKAVDSLSSAIKDYNGCDDDVIDELDRVLKKLRLEKQKRIAETAPLKESISQFNAARSGVLSDSDKLNARSQYDSQPQLRAILSYEAYLELLKQRKAEHAIQSGMERFRGLRDENNLKNLIDRARAIGIASRGTLRTLGSLVDGNNEWAENRMDVEAPSDEGVNQIQDTDGLFDVDVTGGGGL